MSRSRMVPILFVCTTIAVVGAFLLGSVWAQQMGPRIPETLAQPDRSKVPVAQKECAWIPQDFGELITMSENDRGLVMVFRDVNETLWVAEFDTRRLHSTKPRLPLRGLVAVYRDKRLAATGGVMPRGAE